MNLLGGTLLFLGLSAILLHDVIAQSIAKHVVHIGIDGLRPDCMNNAPGGNPNIMGRIAAQGAYTLTKGRAIIETTSAPGWTANLCAMDSTLTGILNESWTPPWEGNVQRITPVTGDKPFPCIYQEIKRQQPTIRTSAWFSWDWLEYLHNRNTPGSVDMQHLCTSGYIPCDAIMVANMTVYLQQLLTTAPSSFSFIYLTRADMTGHNHGWCTPEYLSAVADTDKLVGQILDAVETAKAENVTLVMLSSDHGADDDDHGRPTDSCLHIPVMFRGPAIRTNHQFTQYVRSLDMAPTAMYALGLQPSIHWAGRVVIEAFN